MNSSDKRPLDAMIATMPLSPSDTNPPLGPAILRAAAQRAGLELETRDLNAAFLTMFSGGHSTSRSKLVGDQDKNRIVTRAARRFFIETCPLRGEPLHCPPQADPKLGMHYSFEEIRRAVDEAARPGHFIHDFIAHELFAAQATEPRVLGLSIMGPAGLFFSLVGAAMAKQLWPGTLVVAGGSHVTLMIERIAADARYGRWIDAFMPNHCEDDFASLLHAMRQSGNWREQKGVIEAGKGRVAVPSSADFGYIPVFENADLVHFDPQRLTAPLQFTRGCRYGQCTHCTYPKAEPIVDRAGAGTGMDVMRAVDAVQEVLGQGFRRVSLKDSFLLVPELTRFAREIMVRDIRVEWSVTTMLNESVADAVPILASSGLLTVEFGLEQIREYGQRIIGKLQPPEIVQRVVGACVAHGVAVVINLIYGLPGETLEQARAQLRWFQQLQAHHPAGMVEASHNLLEVNLGAPLAEDSGREAGVELRGLSPWAFSYDWNAPIWREQFQLELREAMEVVYV